MWKLNVHFWKRRLWIILQKLFPSDLLCAVHSYSNKPNLKTIFSSFLYFMNIDWNSVLKVLRNRLKQGKKTRILATYQASHVTYQLKTSSKSHTVKSRVLTHLFRGTAHSGFFQIAYEADYWSLYTVTFWQKVDSDWSASCKFMEEILSW